MTETARNVLLVAVTVVIAATAFYFLLIGNGPTTREAQNLLWPSNNFAGVNWKDNHVTVTPGAGTASDGKSPVSRIVETSDNGPHFAYYSTPATVAARVYTFSLYAKPAELSALRLEIRDDPLPGKYGTAVCDLANGGTVRKDGDVVDAGVEPAAGGWTRCWAAMPFSGVGTVLGIDILDLDGDYEYQGDGRSGLLVWGAQFEPGRKPTAYVATTTGPAMK